MSNESQASPAIERRRNRSGFATPHVAPAGKLFCFVFGGRPIAASDRLILAPGRSFEVAVETAVDIARAHGISPTKIGLRWVGVGTPRVPAEYIGKLLDHKAVIELDAALGTWVN